jgi:ABC-type branched-subunit amino acid transport system ATPase component/ABC-type branched-subunit amino acid transport system permease subunit
VNLALTLLGWDLSVDAAVIGATTGLTYAVLGAGLVLIYRATGILNFAHGEVGTLAGAVLGRLVLQDRWNYWVALLVCTAIGAAVGALTELLVMRRLVNASKLVLLAATLGLAQVLLVLQTMVPRVEQAAPYPAGFSTSVDIGGVTLFGEHLVVLAVVPAIIIGLGAFLTRSRYGLAIRASADNRNAARLAGMSPRRVSLLVWTIAGGVSAVTYILNAPVRGTISGIAAEGLGPSLLLRALAAALVGRFVSLPMTLAGGVAVGVVESQAFINVPPGTVDALIFVIVAVLVLTRIGSTDDGSATLAASGGAPPISTWLPAAFRRLAVIVAVAAAVLLPVVVTSPSQQVLFSRVAIYAIVAVSVVVVTGWSGQLSLCQFAFVGVGAVLTYAFSARGMSYAWACLYASCAGVLAAVVVGLPALRVRGLFLAVTTLGFAVAATGWVLPHDRLFGDGNVAYISRTNLGPVELTSQRTFYYVVLVALGGVMLVARRLRVTGVGRSILAVRENERSAEAMTISAVKAKLLAFGVAGGFAALAGALLAGLETQFQPSDFPPSESLRVVAMTIIGGVGSIAGAVLGAVFVLGLPALLEDSLSVRLLTSGIGLLVILLIQPGGLLELLRSMAAGIARRSGVSGAEPAPRSAHVAPTPRADAAAVAARDGGDGVPVLTVEGVTVRFGGLVAVDDVSLEARQGEVVGLIGTNGAGKSTLLNAISGFVKTTAGRITFEGTALDDLPAYQRSRLGIGRVFQDAKLYPELTARESISIALEAREPSELVPSALWLPPSRQAEWRKQRRTTELLELLELEPIADRRIGELSTGSRRLVEIACLLAVDAKLLLLDEPMAGVAHHETQRFVSLILQARQELDATVLIIEHDMSVIMSMSDRLYCMAAGAVIAEGLPDDVRRDPGVVAAYLGGAPEPARRRRAGQLVAR